jgi:hypothetical protein
MDLARYVDATITDCDSALAVRVVSIPRESLAPHVRNDLFSWPAVLGLKEVARLGTRDEVVSVLAAMLGGGDTAHGVAEAVADRPLVPFGDPIHDVTLVEMATARTAETLDLAYVTLEGSRLLLATVPDGLVVCAEAADLSRALERGLAAKLRELMGLDGRRYNATGPASVTT